MKATLAICVMCGVAAAGPKPSLVGTWTVVGCETSPKDPAPCARGSIVFTSDRVTIDVPAFDHKPLAYIVVASTADRVSIKIDGAVSDITIDAAGEAHWRPPGAGGRIGHLSFTRR